MNCRFSIERRRNHRMMHTTRTAHGWITPKPRQTKRKRFSAWFEKNREIHHNLFPTRKAALDWLQLLEARYE